MTVDAGQPPLTGEDAADLRWARELHDTTLQGMGAALLSLSAGLESDPPSREDVGRAEAILRDEIRRLRAMIVERRPVAEPVDDLPAALRVRAEELRARDGLDVRVALELGSTRLPAARAMAVHRIVGQALDNVVRHAAASRADVVVRVDELWLHVEVTDDGAGGATASAGGYGLLGMRERASLLGGELFVESTPQGTTVRVLIPLVPAG